MTKHYITPEEHARLQRRRGRQALGLLITILVLVGFGQRKRVHDLFHGLIFKHEKAIFPRNIRFNIYRFHVHGCIRPPVFSHTKWSTAAVPFDLIIDLNSVNQLDKFQYLPRLDAGKIGRAHV